MDRSVIGAALLVAAVLGAAALASTLGGHETGTAWGGPGSTVDPEEGCQADHPRDCSV